MSTLLLVTYSLHVMLSVSLYRFFLTTMRVQKNSILLVLAVS